jgi:MOSC domain-containing protein YiiM
MHGITQHVNAIELEQGLADVLHSPADVGRLTAIFVRPAPNERRAFDSVNLTPENGIEGDRWAGDSYYRLKDGGPDPRCQVSVMNDRFLRQVAGDDSEMCLAGDNLIVDFDLSEANLPTGCQIAIGREVIIEISDLKHTGCSKFARRYGQDAKTFANSKQGTALHLRGRYARIVRGGTIRVGDQVNKHPSQE